MEYKPNVVKRLQDRLQGPLPGLDAHMTMAPPLFERKVREGITVPENARQSAVLVLLYLHEGYLHVPLMKRTEDGRVHGGQISLPGGRVEPEDKDLHHTALREAHEEMGIISDEVKILGSLSDIYIIPSNFQVYPSVGFMERRPDFVADPTEVAEIIEVRADIFLKSETRKMQIMTASGGFTYETPGYEVNQRHVVWGGTSMILAEFFTLVKEVLS